jgi:hypothetical protein
MARADGRRAAPVGTATTPSTTAVGGALGRSCPDLQHPAVGSIFPALPGRTDGFRLLALEWERTLTLGWLPLAGSVDVTRTFALEEVTPGVDATRRL